jgi:hypothetical protein
MRQGLSMSFDMEFDSHRINNATQFGVTMNEDGLTVFRMDHDGPIVFGPVDIRSYTAVNMHFADMYYGFRWYGVVRRAHNDRNRALQIQIARTGKTDEMPAPPPANERIWILQSISWSLGSFAFAGNDEQGDFWVMRKNKSGSLDRNLSQKEFGLEPVWPVFTAIRALDPRKEEKYGHEQYMVFTHHNPGKTRANLIHFEFFSKEDVCKMTLKCFGYYTDPFRFVFKRIEKE